VPENVESGPFETVLRRYDVRTSATQFISHTTGRLSADERVAALTRVESRISKKNPTPRLIQPQFSFWKILVGFDLFQQVVVGADPGRLEQGIILQ
jgi:hypothetical protein